MKVRLLIPFVFLGVVGIAVFLLTKNKTSSQNNFIFTNLTHPSAFFEEDSFYRAISEIEKESKPIFPGTRGGIIPHHLYASNMIADFFNRLSAQNPKTIILIGPNHYEKGISRALSSLYGWETEFGVIDPNQEIIQDLVNKSTIKIDEETVPKDHSVTGIMPFIKYYLPETQVVPILISGYMSQEETLELSKILKDYLNEDTVIVASVDFSHYLTNLEAQEKDKITLALIKNFDYQQLYKLNNDYVDSPTSIIVFLRAMEGIGATKMEILDHTNSGQMEKNNSIATTSYFSITYSSP